MKQRIPVEPTRVEFCPIPIHPETDQVQIVKVGKLIGTVCWQFNNGDAIVRTETAFFYIPRDLYKQVASVPLN